jgi:hypothetical protein
MKHLRAVGKEGRTPFTKIQPTRIQLRQQGNQASRSLTFAVGGDPDLREKFLVRQLSDGVECFRHSPLVASQFLPFDDRPSGAIDDHICR